MDKIKYLEELRDKLKSAGYKEFKNWKVLCEFFEWKTNCGTYKQARLKELSIICDWEKEGNKIKINKINDNIQESDIKDGRRNNIVKYTDDYKVPLDKNNNIGVYIIIDKYNNCYIGSTVMGFRKRFRQHKSGYDKKIKHTYDLLTKNNAEFRILYDMTGIKDVKLVRMVEEEFIQYFKSLSEYNVINKNNHSYIKTKKQQYINIKINKNDYNLAIKLLEDNKIDIQRRN